MALHLITGPLNSGRTGHIRERVVASAGANPLVVAPTPASRRELERELVEEAGGALVGPSVTGPDGLGQAVLRSLGLERARLASSAQLLALTQAAIERARPRILARSAQSPGFAAALCQLFADLRSAGVKGDSAPADDPYLAEILAIYSLFVELLEASGLTDRPGLLGRARQALLENPAAWGSRPVFLHGFDDMSRVQRELVETLAQLAPVTVSLTHEDRRSLAARARLFNELAPLAERPIIETKSSEEYTNSKLLFHIERHFGEDDAPRRPADESLRLLQSAGVRGEAELIAEQIKLLIVGGVRPGRIAVASRDPSHQGPAIARALVEAGVPVALEADLPLAATAIGSGLLSLIEATHGGGEAAALVRFLRTPGPPGRREATDRFEFELVRREIVGLSDALALWRRQGGESLAAVEGLLAAGDDGPAFLRALAAAVEAIATDLRDVGDGDLPDANLTLELAAERTLRTALADLERLGIEAAPEFYTRILRQLTLPAAGGPTGDRVRIASPYALYTVRSRRFEHLFVAGLQDREFPRPESEGPFLSREQRLTLGMPELADADAEEMYLFQICLALPTDGLWLSYRIATEEGLDAQPSPFVALVKDLLETGIGRPEPYVIERDIASVVYPAASAPSERELLRALASDRGVRLADDLGRSLDALIARAEKRAARAANPGRLRSPAVLGELAARSEFGASELESYSLDPGRWFIDYGLRPLRFGPDPEPIVLGGLSHRILELLYAARPGGRSKPDPTTLADWRRELDRLVDEVADQYGLARERPNQRVGIHQVRRNLGLFLAFQARSSAGGLEPRLFEASFGSREEDDRPALDFDGWQLTGKIDRVDLSPDGSRALIHDYKFSRNVHPVARFATKGLLQLPLYLQAVRQLWGAEPVGALYHPVRNPRERPRGLLLKDEDALELLAGQGRFDNDLLVPERFEAELADALIRADQAVAGIRSGAIDRAPLPEARAPEPAQASIHRRFGDRFADPEEDWQ